MLDDIQALNSALKLTDTPRLIDFSPVHVVMLNVNEFDQKYFDVFGNYEDVLLSYSALGKAFTAIHHGKPMCCFGVIPLWPGCAECWLVPDVEIGTIARSFHRTSKAIFDIFMSEWRLVRLQVTVNCGNVAASKWIKKMSFSEEGRLQNYGPEGDDYFMFSRLE